MGWRTTAQNFNLNRDYAKADAAEMHAMLRLVNEWDPIATIDLHVTDGAKFEHDVSIQIEPVHAGDAALQRPVSCCGTRSLLTSRSRDRYRSRSTSRSRSPTTLVRALSMESSRRVKTTPPECASRAVPSSRCSRRSRPMAMNG